MKSQNSKAFLAFILLSFSGCAIIPKINEHNLINATSIQTSEKESTQFSFITNNWWTIYNDNNLNNLVAQILKNNTDLKIAQLNIEKSQEYINLAKSNGGPTVNLGGNYQRQRLDLAQRMTSGGKKIINFYGLELQGNYPIDIFGKYSSLEKSAKYQTDAAKMSKELSQLDISNQVTQLYGYYNFLILQEKLLQEKATLLNELEVLEKENVKIGATTTEDLLYLRNSIISNEIDISNIISEEIIISNNLKVLAGNKNNENIDNILNQCKKNPNINLFKKLNIPNTISSDIIANRPDVQYYLFLIDAQKEKLASLKTDFYPQISLTGSFGYNSIKYSDLFNSYSVLGAIGPSIYLPIFRSGQIRNNYKIAGTDLNIFIENYNKTILNSMNNVNNQLAKTKTAWQNYNSTENSYKNSTTIFYDNRDKYNLGYVSKYDYLQAKSEWLDSKLILLQQSFNQYTQQLSLINAVGGSFSKNVITGGHNGK